jgi:hypothetical protein
MGLAADFGKSIVRGAGYSIGRNLVGNLGRNSVTSSYRERVSDSYENQQINQKFQRSIFDVIDGQEESIKQRYEHEIKKTNWQCLTTFQKIGMFSWGVVSFIVIFALFVKNADLYHSIITFDKSGLFSLLICFIFSRLFIKFLYLIQGTKRSREEYANNILEQGNKNIVTLRKSYTEGLQVVKETWGEEWVKYYKNRIPKEGMHISPFTLFFGSPEKEEITEKGRNLIYGTSKQAGDWFKFEDDYLKSFTIK